VAKIPTQGLTVVIRFEIDIPHIFIYLLISIATIAHAFLTPRESFSKLALLSAADGQTIIHIRFLRLYL
jgi:hypothetical protein